MLRRLSLLISLLIFGASALAQTFSHEVFDGLLKKHVSANATGRSTVVDYSGFSADRARLKMYLNSLAAVRKTQFDTWSKNAQLAFLINAYNAWTIELILTRYPKLKSIKDLGSLLQSPWQKRFIPLLGTTYSLDDIEHSLIRDPQRYREPRIHFAVNCASIGCPALRSVAYTGEALQSQLDQATRDFLTDTSRNRLENGTLYVSRIFDWYEKDFSRGWQGVTSLRQFLGTYGKELKLSAAGLKRLSDGTLDIDYLEYDWTLNRKR
jgi:hypothetical protein